MLKRLTGHPTVRRLAVREYIPLALSVATWLMIGLAVGHADVVRLLAANTFVQAARSLATLELTTVFKRRLGSERSVFRASRRTALRIELGGLLACAVLLAGIAWFLDWRGMAAAAAMVAIGAISLPARHPGMVLVIGRDRAATWRIAAAATGAIGAAAVLLMGLEWWAAAIVFALRDWGGLLASLLFAPRRDRDRHQEPTPLTFAEAAGQTESTARQRLTYRIGKSMLGAILGPFGSIAARTGRGVQIDRKLSRYIPRHRGGFVIFTAVTLAGGLAFLLVSREPSALLLGAALLRVSASGGSALLWWNYGSVVVDQEDDDDD